MSLPPWKSDRREDQEALARFVIGELDRDDARSAHEAGQNADGLHHLKLLGELGQIARKLNMSVSSPKRPSRSGPKPRKPQDDDFTDFERAALDVPRIRAIFRRHWGKRNRTQRPLAQEIAAQRWELNAAETAKLIDKFRRKT